MDISRNDPHRYYVYYHIMCLWKFWRSYFKELTGKIFICPRNMRGTKLSTGIWQREAQRNRRQQMSSGFKWLLLCVCPSLSSIQDAFIKQLKFKTSGGLRLWALWRSLHCLVFISLGRPAVAIISREAASSICCLSSFPYNYKMSVYFLPPVKDGIIC